MLTVKQGSVLMSAARNAIKKSFDSDYNKYLSEFNEKLGVFVTILEYPSLDLRGCIGFPYPEIELGKAVIQGAKAAAFSDPRFPPLQKNEINKMVIEISILSEPKEIKCKKEELANNVKIGRDGLIVRFGGFSGLLLPQVPIEWKWDSQQFLRQTCIKAGLPAETWKKEACKFFKFQAQIFSEKSPNGKVIERKI
ncbi:MAG: TIGR00296 family protein [archaeon]